nr:retrovirus-related Pol polyprotein from transposon TNT 1-94 [Tanacetum cinerariifolium]
MIGRSAGNEFFCFLDGFSVYFHISIDPQDQGKTTFTCPYGNFTCRRMPFGLCNAPDLKLAKETKAKSSIEEPLELELKELPSHLEYVFLEESNKLPVIIAKDLKDDEKEALIKVLKSHKQAIALKIFDIKGIDPRFCTHKILMEEDYKPAIQSQRKVNPKIHDVIKKEVIKLLDAGVIPTTSVSRPQLKSNPMEDRVMLHNSQGKKQEVEDHRRNVKFSKNKCLLVQRGLHAQVRIVRTDKGTEFLNQTLHAYFACEGILHQTSVARTPEQNDVVERRNRTLVEAAQTMLSAAKVPLFFWGEAIATTCFTQNFSLVIPLHEKTPYHIINDRKPPVKFFYIFGSLCYIISDGENLDKIKEKGDACIFVGYSTQSRAYRVFNKRTRVIMETIHVNFDELPQMASDHISSDLVP